MNVGLRTMRVLLGAFVAAAVAPGAGSAADADAAAAPDAKQVDVGAIAAQALPHGPGSPGSPGSLDLHVRAEKPPQHGLLAGRGLVVPIGETLATNLVIMQWNRSVGGAPWADVSVDSVGRNLRSGWVLDDDDFWVNQFGHPYQGTWSFTAARSSGLGFWASTPFPVVASALWEVAGETTAPSWNDQITTSVSGMVFGEVLYRFAGALRAEGGTWNEVFASVLAPMGALNKALLGTSQVIRPPPSRWQLGIGGAAFSGASVRAGQPVPYGALSFTYGLPGSPELELDRPFDHFVLDLGWTATGNPAATVLARGLLAGATFDGSLARGLWGAYLSFDFDTPPRHRVSTSAVGVGGSASADLGGGFALEGDAVASAVLLGAGGKVDRPDGLGRDYRFGPGEQALLAVRLLAGSRVATGVTVRQYLLFGAGGDVGTEQLLHGTASLSIRLYRSSGIGLELNRYLRRAEVAGATVREADSAVRVYFMVCGGA